jgi:hypothetical protein
VSTRTGSASSAATTEGFEAGTFQEATRKD